MIEYIVLCLNGLALGIILTEVCLLSLCFYNLINGVSIWENEEGGLK